jgi:hypothetical protein
VKGVSAEVKVCISPEVVGGPEWEESWLEGEVASIFKPLLSSSVPLLESGWDIRLQTRRLLLETLEI